MSERIDVHLGARSYAIHVGAGLIDRAGELIRPLAQGGMVVVTDRNVAPLHLERLLDSLRATGIEARPIVLDPGEETKSFRGLEQLTGELLSAGLERDGLVLAFGGGVIGDITGFAAGVLKRGLGYAQLPTTLLAQVDSSVGGKTAINTKEGKNLVGQFHQPRIVIADTALLATLPRRELLAGYAEVAKYGALGDESFFEWLESHALEGLTGNAAYLDRMIAHSCRIKADIVGRDERETGERALLNLGHTFGHALEAATGYSARLLHGEAVSIGMVLAFRLSAELGYSHARDADRLEEHLRGVSLPVSVADIPGLGPDVETLLAHMMHDKKSKNGRLTFVLARGIGQAFTTSDVPPEAVRNILAA
ncbi:MAG TPA: 3-dehydroquinate synthase [Rhizomicrobium sp.]|jgi:3-dehydroquinate synthase|nr:3-dehydroquinate synthase [Rhizomicrobium sp.]